MTDTTAELTLEDGTRLVQNTNGWRYAFSPTRTVVEVSISPDGAAHCDIG
ncbi:MAG: hypothetical protein HQ478_04500 [Chloroflexi bacterium]|nr:hypothetical protein [Chloroflexota bacterium]